VKQGVQYVLLNETCYRIIYVRCENNETLKENKMNVTKQSRVLEALQSGEQLTAKQIAARFGVKNPTATISDIRLSGFAVYANQHKDTKGRVTTKYRLGTPSRELVAAGYRAMSLGIAV
jgi:predicted ArsR family transcriptional regulator